MKNTYVNWLRAVLAVTALTCAVAAHAQAYVAPTTPSGWSAPVVVTTDPNSTTDTTPLYSTNEVYVDWAINNTGNSTASSSFYLDLYSNSVYLLSWSISDESPDEIFYVAQPGYDVGEFPVGTNTVEIVVDPTEVYDNPPATYTKTFVVLAPFLPALSAPVLNTPANGSTNQSTSPVFTWSSVSNAQDYVIMVATNSADLPTNTIALTNGPSGVIIADVTNTTFTPMNPIVPGTKYYWEVNARYLTEGGPWSSTFNFTTAPATAGLVIIPSFDSSITTDPQAVAIENTIEAAIGVYENDFSDPITVSITFQEMNGGLGESDWSYNSYSYSAYRSALVSAATTADDSTALAHLPAQADNPVNGNPTMNIKTALAWALGLNGGSSGENIGTVSLYTGIMNVSQAQNNPDNYSLFSTASHEIDEMLATGSALDQVYAGESTLTGPVFPEDLFRYGAPGVRSYTTSASAISYFSLDGTNDLAQFNQNGVGDLGDWYSYGGVQTVSQVQDAFALPDTSPNLGVELRVLDVLGYHLVVAPAPIFQSVTRTGSSLKLTWTAISGRSYQLLDSTNLNLGVWNNLGSSVTASSSTASYTDTIVGTQKFYRVELLALGSNLVRTPQVVVPPTGWGTNVLHAYHP